MNEIDTNLLIVGLETLIALAIANCLVGDQSRRLPKRVRLLIALGSAVLFAQTALTLSQIQGSGPMALQWMTYTKDLCIATLAFVAVIAVSKSGDTPSARTSRTSPPSDLHPTA